MEKFDTIEGPIQPVYQYMLVKEFGDELFRCDFNKKWYLPAAGIPGFELDIYRGNYFLYCKLIVDMSFIQRNLS